jgi:hypothetical protein
MRKTLFFLGILMALTLVAANPMPGITNVESNLDASPNDKPPLCYHPLLQKYVLCNRGSGKNLNQGESAEPTFQAPTEPQYTISGRFFKSYGLNKFSFYRNNGLQRGFSWYRNVGRFKNPFECKFNYQF